MLSRRSAEPLVAWCVQPRLWAADAARGHQSVACRLPYRCRECRAPAVARSTWRWIRLYGGTVVVMGPKRAHNRTQRPTKREPVTEHKPAAARHEPPSTPAIQTEIAPGSTATIPSETVPALQASEQCRAEELALSDIRQVAAGLFGESIRVESASFSPDRRLYRVFLCTDATIGDCETLTKALVADNSWEHGMDIQSLEVSSPGVGDVLQHDRAFQAFRSFPVIVTFTEEHPKYGMMVQGNLVDRDETSVRISQGGKVLRLERAAVREVRLVPAEEGDNL